MKPLLLSLVAGFALNGANLLTNASFETQTIGPATFLTLNNTSAFLTGWVVTGGCPSGCVLVISNGYTQGSGATFNAQDGNQHLDLTGPGNTSTGGVQQTVNLAIGVPHTLTFWVGNQDNAIPGFQQASVVELLINGVSQGTFSNNNNTTNNLNWLRHTYGFTPGVAANTILFRNATVVDGMAGLDNVSLEVAAVPEPATPGVLAIALVALLRRKVAVRG